MLFTLVCIVAIFSVLHGLKIQAIFFFDEATDWTWGGGARRARGARRGGSGFREKTRLINGAGSGFRVRLAGRVRVQRNPTQTRPVAIPTFATTTDKVIMESASDNEDSFDDEVPKKLNL